MKKRSTHVLQRSSPEGSAISRREFATSLGIASAYAALPAGLHALAPSPAPDYRLEVADYKLEVAKNRFLKTVAYNQQVPGPLLRLHEGRPVTIEVTNKSRNQEIVHWHGLFLPSDVDGAMEEGTPMIPSGSSTRITFTPSPTGFRWYHTHTFAGTDLKKAQYTGEHGFLYIEPRESPGRYDQEAFLALHDWDGLMQGGADGSMNPTYPISTINGRTLGFGDPLRVKQGQRLLLHILNSSPTEEHWISFSGHSFQVIALDGNPVPTPKTVSMLCLSPAERVSALVELNNPGVWVIGEIRKHIKEAGMAMAVEYEGQTGKPQWQQPTNLFWDYNVFSAPGPAASHPNAINIPLVFKSKFKGHGAPDAWTINGKSYPDTESIALTRGQRYRLLFDNQSMDDHPVHLHRHSFELRQVSNVQTHGIVKDVVRVQAGSKVHVEFTANNPGKSLFHCHQQNHMDAGFMMLFHYA